MKLRHGWGMNQAGLLVPKGAAADFYRDAVLALSPVAYYRLDEGAGSTLTDAIGSYDGTYINSPTLQQDPGITVGKAVDFEASSLQSAEISDSSWPIANGSSAFSIQAWFKTESLPTTDNATRQVIVQNAQAPCLMLAHDGVNPIIRFQTQTASSTYRNVDQQVALETGRWYHVVGTYDNTSFKLYIDGVLVDELASASQTTYTNLGTKYVAVGKYWDNATSQWYFDGLIDEVAIYTTALTADQIADLDEKGRTVFFQDGFETLTNWTESSSGDFVSSDVAISSNQAAFSVEVADSFSSNALAILTFNQTLTGDFDVEVELTSFIPGEAGWYFYLMAQAGGQSDLYAAYYQDGSNNRRFAWQIATGYQAGTRVYQVGKLRLIREGTTVIALVKDSILAWTELERGTAHSADVTILLRLRADVGVTAARSATILADNFKINSGTYA